MQQDPFDVLSLPPRFDLDPAEIRRAWLARAAHAHPDRADDPTDEVARLSAALNHARRTLEDPERRANALLRRLGGPAKELDKSLPPDFLAEMLAIRDEMDESRRAGLPLDRFEAWAERRRSEHMQRAAARFAALPPSPDAADLRAIRTELNAWRYIERMIEQLDPDYDPQRADFAD